MVDTLPNSGELFRNVRGLGDQRPLGLPEKNVEHRDPTSNAVTVNLSGVDAATRRLVIMHPELVDPIVMVSKPTEVSVQEA